MIISFLPAHSHASLQLEPVTTLRPDHTTASLRKMVRSIIWMCSTKVQPSPSATISVRPSSHTVWCIRLITPTFPPHGTHCNCLCNDARQHSVPVEMNVPIWCTKMQWRYWCDRGITEEIISVCKNLHGTGVIFIRMGQESSGVIETLQDPGITGKFFLQDKTEQEWIFTPVSTSSVHISVYKGILVYVCIQMFINQCSYVWVFV